MRFEEATFATRALRLSLAAIAVSAAFGGQMARWWLTWSAAQAQEAVRGEIGRPLQAARDLIKAKKYSEALAKLREADAVPNRNANENFLLEQMRASAALSAGDNGQAIKAIQFLLSSARLPSRSRRNTRAALPLSITEKKTTRTRLSGRARRCERTRLTARCAACKSSPITWPETSPAHPGRR